MLVRLLSRIVLAASLLGAADASAGVLRGRLSSPPLPQREGSPNPYPGVASALPNAHVTPRGSVTDAIVYLETIPAAAESALAHGTARPQLAQKDQCFAPRVLPIAVGTTVDFPNQDPIYHNVFSVSPVKRFDLGKYSRGFSKPVTFTKAGTVNVYCDIHSSMAATVLVIPHHAFTQPDAEGRFALPDLPPGHYVLKVWHPDRPELRREVEIPARGDLRVDLGY